MTELFLALTVLGLGVTVAGLLWQVREQERTINLQKTLDRVRRNTHVE